MLHAQLAWTIALLALVAYRTSPTETPPATDAMTAGLGANQAPSAPLKAAHAETSAGAQPDAGPHAAPRAAPTLRHARAVGHTSVVFKLGFDDGSSAAFKPVSRRGDHRYRGEIAAYQLAQQLGLADRVPEAHAYAIAPALLSGAAVNAATRDLVAAEVLGDKGALIPWIDNLQFPSLERNPQAAHWKQLLHRDTQIATLAPAEAELASAMSALCIFDYLTGNFDRFSGGNIGLASGRLLFVDNDGAFLDPAPADAQIANRARILAIWHFSSSLWQRASALTFAELTESLGANSPAELSASQIEAVLARRDSLRDIFASKRLELGDAQLFAFP